MLPVANQFCNPGGPEALQISRGHPSLRRPVPPSTPACQRFRLHRGSRGHSMFPARSALNGRV